MAILAECPQCHKKQSVRNKVCGNKECGKDLDKAKRANRKLEYQDKTYTCGAVRYWIDYIVPGTGKAKREPVASANDPKAYSIEEMVSWSRKGQGSPLFPHSHNQSYQLQPGTGGHHRRADQIRGS